MVRQIGSEKNLEMMQRRIRVARGQEPGDLRLTGGKVVNVFTQQVEPANVVIADGWIAGVGPYAWEATDSISCSGRVIAPGFVDAHMHLESTLLTPAELARLILPHGTTAIISDSHEIGNVLGLPGIDMLLSASEGLPFDLFFTASSCVPATKWEHAGAVLGPREVNQLLGRSRLLGLAEIMDIPAVLNGEQEVLEKIEAARVHQRVVDGHAPGMNGLDLQAYVGAGIRSDHESATVEEARAKAALGMLVQVREGSSARNLETILPLLVSGELGDSWCLVTDDVFPNDLVEEGHLDGMVRRLVKAGVAPANAVRHTTLVPFRHYGINDRGAVAPGYRGDLVVFEDEFDFRPHLVLKNGRVVAHDVKFIGDISIPRLEHSNSIHLKELDISAFRLRLKQETCPVIGVIQGQIITRLEMQNVSRVDGYWNWEANQDVLAIASIERHKATGNIGLGLVKGFGLRRGGALGSSVAHDSHNLIVAGTNPRDMLACVRGLQEMGGGFVVASEGEVRAKLPLPVAGLLSLENAETVCRQLHLVYGAARTLGCPLASPFGTLSFMALPVIGDIRITDQGLFDVRSQKFLHL
jgi:adenine deaminase